VIYDDCCVTNICAVRADESDTSEPPDSKGSTLRQILDQRRLLVMQLFDKHGLYPTGTLTAVCVR